MARHATRDREAVGSYPRSRASDDVQRERGQALPAPAPGRRPPALTLGGPLTESVLNLEDPLLAGRAVVVTGSGKGLGREYAIAASLHGASVVLNDVDVDAAGAVAREISEAGGRVETVNGDIAN